MLDPRELIEQVRELSDELVDRRLFHERARLLLQKMSEPAFIHFVFEMNLKDPGYLKREWSTYEIPFLYIFENDHFYMKYHVFPPVESRDTEKAANIVHHHNNYLLTSYTVQGPGYHTMHFDKQVDELGNNRVRLKLTKDFYHGDKDFSFVDSYEPHLVFNMKELTTTLVLWSPDQKRTTDKFRNNRLIKPLKQPIIKLIHLFGAGRSFGIADKNVYQWYVQNGECIAISEEDYFAKYKAVKGESVNRFYAQAVCKFVQQSGYRNDAFLMQMLAKDDLPRHWSEWLVMLLNDVEIPEVFGKEDINIPSGKMTKTDVRATCA